MSITLEQFSGLVSEIYKSSLTPELWQSTFSKTAMALDSTVNSGAISLVGEEGGIGWLYRCGAMEESNAPYDLDERSRLIRLLAPHFQQALRTQFELAELGNERDGLRKLLQYAKHGVVLTTHTSQIVFANNVATSLLAKHEALEVRTGALFSQQVTAQINLRRLIDAAGRGNVAGVRSCGSFNLKRSSGGRALAVHILPCGNTYVESQPQRATVLILIVDPDDEQEPQAETLKKLYGLTKAEAVVATRVTKGEGLQTVADALGVSLSTVRIHLQRVFEKTDTHRQAELVRLLLTVQAGIQIPTN